VRLFQGDPLVHGGATKQGRDLKRNAPAVPAHLTATLAPQCRDLGAPGYYTEVRLYWSPPVECGEDPCTEDEDTPACWDYWDCLDFGGMGWTEMSSQTVSLEVEVEVDDLRAVDFAENVALTPGEMDDEGGG